MFYYSLNNYESKPGQSLKSFCEHIAEDHISREYEAANVDSLVVCFDNTSIEVAKQGKWDVETYIQS